MRSAVSALPWTNTKSLGPRPTSRSSGLSPLTPPLPPVKWRRGSFLSVVLLGGTGA
jgi:hypothetical protein